MKMFKLFLINIIDKFYPIEKIVLPKSVIKKIYYFISTAFEEEAIDCYLSDKQDIGFFESFILGADETKKISNETNQRMQNFRKGDIIEKLSGYITPRHIIQRQEEELMRDYIHSKKEKVIDMLKQKGEIIRYLGRRIVTRNEILYQKLERIYNRLYLSLRDSIDKDNPPKE